MQFAVGFAASTWFQANLIWCGEASSVHKKGSILSYFIDRASSLSLPSHLSFLLPFLNSNTKIKRQQKQAKWKQVHVGMEPSTTN